MTVAKDVVFTWSFESIEDARERHWMRPPDRFVRALAADRSVERVLVADPPRSWLVPLVRRTTAPRTILPGAVEGRYFVAPGRTWPAEPATLSAAKRVYKHYDAQLARAARAAKLHDPVLITCHPLIAAFCPADWAARVVYYARDDWAAHPSYARIRRATLSAYERLRISERDVAAVSEALLDKLPTRGRGHVVHNGVEASLWSSDLPPVPPWMASIPRPWLLYVGSVDGRLDVQAIKMLASQGAGSIVLLGPVMDPEVARALQGELRVFVVGGKPHGDVVAAVRRADVCLLVHRRTRLTEVMDPLKIYEYLAGGRPVVASRLPAMRAFEGSVHLVDPGQDPTEAVRDALRHGPVAEPERLAYVRDNDWGRRYQSLLSFARD